MKKIGYRHGTIGAELAELIENNGITMTCNDDMTISISESDYAKLAEIAPAAIDDFYESEQ